MREKACANNNLAGATWEQGLAQEADVIQRGFQAQIDNNRARPASANPKLSTKIKPAILSEPFQDDIHITF